MTKYAIALLLVTFSFTPLRSFSDEKKPPSPSEQAHQELKRKETEFRRKERNRRWEFEEKVLQSNRQYEDEIRKGDHDAELEDDTLNSSGGDPREVQKQLSERRKARSEKRRERSDTHRKEMDELRKKFREESEAERKTFKDSLGKK
jgi:hypothetical protein